MNADDQHGSDFFVVHAGWYGDCVFVVTVMAMVRMITSCTQQYMQWWVKPHVFYNTARTVLGLPGKSVSRGWPTAVIFVNLAWQGIPWPDIYCSKENVSSAKSVSSSLTSTTKQNMGNKAAKLRMSSTTTGLMSWKWHNPLHLRLLLLCIVSVGKLI